LREFDWRLNPNSDTLRAAWAAQEARTAVENELREQLLGDQNLFSDVMRSDNHLRRCIQCRAG